MILCWGCEFPRDPHGTADRVRGHVLRVGMTQQAPWAVEQNGERSGFEVELVQKLAAEQQAKIVWQAGNESELVKRLERGELDLAIGGFVRPTPWEGRVALTRSWGDAAGLEHVFLVPPGENRWLLLLDRWLAAHAEEIRQWNDRKGV
ncbi:hypothetical protein DSM3645_12716 [Blastopirellula marina DSM 3645]|uniref:Solute-binding protein family 3/N-terminal domain-containing protein n=1 Tax=Blastopirellula marina DSM 3645 TaxID=314230 RepID=A3ZRW3_9BACT|nr:hypothetical protein DSM3645_12716 [Blastopirellula marina DSM 3645]